MALDRYLRITNDLQFNPETMVERIERDYLEQLAIAEGAQSSLDGELSLASIEQMGYDVRAMTEHYEARDEALRVGFQQAMN